MKSNKTNSLGRQKKGRFALLFVSGDLRRYMANMNNVDKIVDVWEKSLVESIDLGGLFSRDPIAHKWKATYRITVLR